MTDIGDVFTETTEESWGSRLMESIKGVVVGFIFFLISFGLLFWNEGRAVKTAKSLKEGQSLVKTVSPDKVDPRYDKKLVHMIGTATTNEVLRDERFGISRKALKLSRNVQMYQWKEHVKTSRRKKLGGRTTRVKKYTYERVWSSHHISSASFRITKGHTNPTSIPYSQKCLTAKQITLGAFTLDQGLVNKINDFKNLTLTPDMLKKLPADLQSKFKISGGRYFYQGNPSSPQIGDVRVSFSYIDPCTVSIVARQLGSTFEPYMTTVGRSLEMLSIGKHSAENMFQAALRANTFWTWILRFVGFFMMLIGLMMMFSPFTTLADVIPFLGDLLGVGVFLVSAVVAFCLSLLTIAIAWLFYRPVLAITLITIGVGSVFLAKKGFAKKPAAATVPVPSDDGANA